LLTHGKNFLIEKTNVNCCVEVWKLAEARTISSISQIATEALFSRLASESREGELCALKYCDFADIMRKEKVKILSNRYEHLKCQAGSSVYFHSKKTMTYLKAVVNIFELIAFQLLGKRNFRC